jgi:formate hydrogenlyase subunit 3/multisubunit Na+/H+ antiporter MnhD subunit
VSTDVTTSEAMEQIMYEMPTAAWCMLGTTISMAGVIVLVGKALGGFRYV